MGLNIANDLLAVGCNVSLVDLKPEPETIRTEPGKAAYFQGDATDETFVGEVTSSTVSAHGGLDHLVNATGVLWFDRDRSIVDIDMDLWDRVIDINLRSFAPAGFNDKGCGMTGKGSIQRCTGRFDGLLDPRNRNA